MTKIRYIDGTWEVTEDDDTSFFAGRYAIENIYRHYQNVGRLIDEAKAHSVAFDCKEFAPHFRRFIRFCNGSWHRLMDDGTWAPNSSLSAVRGCLIYHRLHFRVPQWKEMLAYLKANPQ